MKLVTRPAWDAQPFLCSEPRPVIDALVVHYTASDADEQADHANCAARVRAIQSFHIRPKSEGGRGWCDIAYNFLVCKHGFVFEGRGWDRKSGATGDANSHTLAIAFLGDDTAGRDDVTHDGREALGQWIRRARQLHAGAKVRGHRNFMSTACPGDELMAWLASGQWKTIGLPRWRYELWIVRDGKPELLRKSRPARREKAHARAAEFVANNAKVIAFQAFRGRKPRVRKVRV